MAKSYSALHAHMFFARDGSVREGVVQAMRDTMDEGREVIVRGGPSGRCHSGEQIIEQIERGVELADFI